MNQPRDLYAEVQSGGDAKAFLLDLHRRNTGGLSLEEIKHPDIADMPTMMVPVIPKSPPFTTTKMTAAILAPSGIYTDRDGRQCLKIIDVAAHTIDLVDKLVGQFYKLTGAYPDHIIPCPSRYVLLRLRDFCPNGGSPIPYSRDFTFPVDYDILVRRNRNGTLH